MPKKVLKNLTFSSHLILTPLNFLKKLLQNKLTQLQITPSEITLPSSYFGRSDLSKNIKYSPTGSINRIIILNSPHGRPKVTMMKVLARILDKAKKTLFRVVSINAYSLHDHPQIFLLQKPLRKNKKVRKLKRIKNEVPIFSPNIKIPNLNIRIKDKLGNF